MEINATVSGFGADEEPPTVTGRSLSPSLSLCFSRSTRKNDTENPGVTRAISRICLRRDVLKSSFCRKRAAESTRGGIILSGWSIVTREISGDVSSEANLEPIDESREHRREKLRVARESRDATP